MKRAILILLFLTVALFATACTNSPDSDVPNGVEEPIIEAEDYIYPSLYDNADTAEIEGNEEIGVIEDSDGDEEEFDAYDYLDFVPLLIIEDPSVLVMGETFTVLGLSLQYRPHYFVLRETQEMGMLRSLDGVNIIISTMPGALGYTITDIVEMTMSNAVGEFDVLEKNDLLINDITWGHKTVAFNFEGEGLFQTMLFTEKDGIGYIFSYAAPKIQMENLRADRALIISSIRIMSGLGRETGDVQVFFPDSSIADEPLFVDSDNWQFFFQENSDEDIVRFARRFVLTKTNNAATNAFFEGFGVYESAVEIVRDFEHGGQIYYIFEFDSPLSDSDYPFTSLVVMREDFLTGVTSMDFSRHNPSVSIEIPSDEIIARTQKAVNTFSDLLDDYNGVAVSAESFNTAEQLAGPFAMFEPSSFAVRSDDFSQIIWKITGETISIDFIALILIYDGDNLVGAMLTPGNVVQ